MLKQYNNPNSTDLKIMHFLPGNSFTPCTYSRLLDSFSDNFLIKIFLLRPLWDNNPMPKFKNWDIFLNDYLESINRDTLNIDLYGNAKIIDSQRQISGDTLIVNYLLNLFTCYD